MTHLHDSTSSPLSLLVSGGQNFGPVTSGKREVRVGGVRFSVLWVEPVYSSMEQSYCKDALVLQQTVHPPAFLSGPRVPTFK